MLSLIRSCQDGMMTVVGVSGGTIGIIPMNLKPKLCTNFEKT